MAGGCLKVAVFSTNLTFFPPIAEAIKAQGHEILYWKENNSFMNGYNIGKLLSWCDIAFIEFCQTPMAEVLSLLANDSRVVVAARMHRIEMYNSITADPKVDWGRVDIFFGTSPHVIDRFMEYRTNKSKPFKLFHAPSNIVDPTKFNYQKKNWKPPIRLCLLGNFVPKKGQYQAIQFMWDLKKEFGNYFKLDIIGTRGQWSGYGNPEYYQNCLDLISDLNLSDTVTIYDPVPHDGVPSLLSREHIIISNSVEEGTHVAIAEGAMMGCIPFCNYWRGVSEIYPDPEIAWHHRSGMEFFNNCKRLKDIIESGKAEELSETISRAAIKIYGSMEKYNKMVNIMEESVTQKGKIISK
jgi:glycosyltransferase involved in cell wall biosynthesis